MSKEINHSNLVYDFKGQTPSINFEKTQPVEEDKKKKIKSE